MGMFHSNNKEEIDSSDSDTQRSKKKKKHPKIPFMQQVKAVLYSWVNVLLIFVPVGIALEYAHVNKIIVFVSYNLSGGIAGVAWNSSCSDRLYLFHHEVENC